MKYGSSCTLCFQEELIHTKPYPHAVYMDDLTDSLKSIQAELPEARTNLGRAEILELIRVIGGPRTARSVMEAKKSLPFARIPFLFSSLELQCVVDILANDIEYVLTELEAGGKNRTTK